MSLAYHARMLGDIDRIAGYRRAIEAVVRPGDVVVDLGAGTGILSLIAARAGARRVYAIDHGEISDVARALVADSPYRDVVRVIRSSVEQAELPERADVMITETLGNFVVDEDIELIVASARERLLVPGAREIPRKVEVAAVPVELPELLARRFRLDVVEGIDIARFARALEQEAYFAAYVDVPETAALAEPETLWRAAIGSVPPTGRCTWTASRAGTLSALALVIRADLAPDVTIATRLGRASNWFLPILPIAGAVRVAPGDRIDANVRLARDGITSWDLTWSRGSKRLGETLQGPSYQRRLLGLPPLSRPRLRDRVARVLRRFR